MSQDIKPLNLAVVGHTNTGKTSLLRTLLRDENFGEVADQAGTTRHVESASLITASGQTILVLHDTPGLEDAMGLLDYLDQLVDTKLRLDGPEKIALLINSPAADTRFEQESRVLNTILNSDAALYVIDTRDPVLPKHKDELSLLAFCGKPILPILNFTHNNNTQTWRKALARLGLHISLDFDTIAPPLDGPDKLINRLQLLLDQQNLSILAQDIQEQRQYRLKDASNLVAELLINAASFRLSSANEPDKLEQATKELRNKINALENKCIQDLLKRYEFNPNTYPQHQLPLSGERWGMDLFNPEALREFGIQLSKGAATGAMAGLTIDALLGGLSLGSAALIGALAGGSWQGINKWGKRIAGRITGQLELSIDEPVLNLLGLRQLLLIQALEQRGHAAIEPIKNLADSLSDKPTNNAPGPDKQYINTSLPKTTEERLKQAKTYPNWSSLDTDFEPSERRSEVIKKISQDLYNFYINTQKSNIESQ